MIEWNKYFDHIYCVNFVKYKDRHDFVEKELERIGINTKADYFSWKYTTDSPFYDYLLDSPTFKKDETNPWWKWKENKMLIRCGLAHYSIWKEAIDRKFKNILIFEDDIIFLKDVEYIEKVINDIPKNYDIILYDKFICMGYNKYSILLNQHKYDEYYTEWGLYDEYLGSLGFYTVSNNFCKYLVEKSEEVFCPVDHYINNLEKDNYIRYFSTINLGLQKEYSPDKNYFEIAYKKLGVKKEWYNY